MNTFDQIKKQIAQIEGMEEYKALAWQLLTVARNQKKQRIEQVQMPCFAMVAAAGSGVTLHLHLLADWIEILGLMPFEGDRNCVEWTPSLGQGDGAQGITSLRNELKKAAGFYGIFRGVVGINLTQLLKMQEWEHIGDTLRQILRYAQTHRLIQAYIFILPMEADEELRQLVLDQIHYALPLQVIQMPFPEEGRVLDYMAQKLREKGFTVEDDAAEALRGLTGSIRKSKDFNGYQTLLNTVGEIVWRKLSVASGNVKTVTVEDVEAVKKNVLIDRRGPYRSIGFKGGKA